MHSTLYYGLLFGSAVLVASAIFYGATSEGFERWRKRMVDRYDRSNLAKHMERAGTSFRVRRKNGKDEEIGKGR